MFRPAGHRGAQRHAGKQVGNLQEQGQPATNEDEAHRFDQCRFTRFMTADQPRHRDTDQETQQDRASRLRESHGPDQGDPAVSSHLPRNHQHQAEYDHAPRIVNGDDLRQHAGQWAPLHGFPGQRP